jgi:hypothetical protein
MTAGSSASLSFIYLLPVLAVTKIEQPLPGLLFVVKSHEKFIRSKASNTIPYQPSPFEDSKSSHTVIRLFLFLQMDNGFIYYASGSKVKQI